MEYTRHKLASVFGLFRHMPGLSFVTLLYIVICLASIRPGMYLIGWDNFSSYFALPINLFRTFFATWRQYRGFGSPSDSEATDLFRQLFYLVLSPLVPEAMLDQLYLLAALGVGLFAMYFLARFLWQTYLPHTNTKRLSDICGFFAAFFYLCNLNTLSVFAFPMIMYTNRFFSIPLLVLIFLLVVHRKIHSKLQYVLVVLAIFFMSGSYITATILITMLMLLVLLGLFSENKKRFALVLLFFFLLNAFWLFPFANYTKEKSGIIRLAPNFITANETQFNKGKDFYDLRKQLVLYHNFFDTKYSDIEKTKDLYFHNITNWYQQPFYQAVLYLFPLLYIAGFVLMLVKFRIFKRLLWLPLTTILFLFLSAKEFSPFGFLYSFFNDLTPFFGVLFRFGDTKFHAYIAFSGSILAAMFLTYVAMRMKRPFMVVVTVVFVASTLFVFRDYMLGKLIGSFMYVQLPSAYKELATTLNNDPSYFRVLHLPFDRNAYWKSYAWGGVGSSFVHFMLKPALIDKTFEPASMENAYMHNKIADLLVNYQNVSDEEGKLQKTTEFATLLQKTNVKYVIFDDSIQAAEYPRGILLWGKFNNPDVAMMVSDLKRYGLAKSVKSYQIPLLELEQAYSQWYPLSDKQKESLFQNPTSQIELLEIQNIQPKLTFLNSVSVIDPNLKNVLETNFGISNSHVLQDPQKPSSLYPLKRRDGVMTVHDDSLLLDVSTSKLSKDLVVSSPNTQNTRYIDIYTHQTDTNMIVSFYTHDIPLNVAAKNKIKDIVIPLKSLPNRNAIQTPMKQVISDWSNVPFQNAGGLRLKVDDYVLPLPNALSVKEQFVGTVAVFSNTIPLDVIQFKQRQNSNLTEFNLTNPPNCFRDSLQDASYTFTKENGFLLTSRNQSTCLFYDLSYILTDKTDHAEFTFDLAGTSTDLDKNYRADSPTSKPRLSEFVSTLPKPNAFRVCVKEPQVDDCYNLHQFANVTGTKTVTFPLETSLSGASDMDLFVSLKNTTFQEQTLEMRHMYVDQFLSVVKDEMVMPPIVESTRITPVKDTLHITIPKAFSKYSYFFNPQHDVLYGQNAPCATEKGYRTFRLVGGKLLTYAENCFEEVFQQANFSSDNYYLWTVSYNLLSGKYPQFIVDDRARFYTDEFVSLYQGYPDVPGFKSYQNPEMLFGSPKMSVDSLNGLPIHTGYGYLQPKVGQKDYSQKKFTIHQDSENEGALLIDSFTLQPLPTAWEDLQIHPNDSTDETYQQPERFSYKQILPSLWKVEITSKQSGTALLQLSEGYDRQWTMYESVWGVLFGLSKNYTSIRCDGFANCYEIQIDNSGQTRTMYIFYTPERLMVLGWLVTLIGGVLLSRFIVNRKINEGL